MKKKHLLRRIQALEARLDRLDPETYTQDETNLITEVHRRAAESVGRAIDANLPRSWKALQEGIDQNVREMAAVTRTPPWLVDFARQEGLSPIGLVVNNSTSIGRAAEPQTEPNPHPDNYWLGGGDVVVGTGGPVDKPPVEKVLTADQARRLGPTFLDTFNAELVDETWFAKGDEIGKHPFDAGFTGQSETCNELVMRDGAGDTCGMTRHHSVHLDG